MALMICLCYYIYLMVMWPWDIKKQWCDATQIQMFYKMPFPICQSDISDGSVLETGCCACLV